MIGKANRPTWPELARVFADGYVCSLEGEKEALKRGDSREAAKWAKEAKENFKVMKKFGITIVYT
jgi:hypothetical protein